MDLGAARLEAGSELGQSFCSDDKILSQPSLKSQRDSSVLATRRRSQDIIPRGFWVESGGEQCFGPQSGVPKVPSFCATLNLRPSHLFPANLIPSLDLLLTETT